MKRDFANGTLQLHRPWGITLGLAFIILLFFLLAGETLFRSEMVHAALVAPGMGSEHRQFAEQLNRFEAYASENQPVDCIFIGNSTIMTDFAPDVFERAYKRETDEEIDCYNFGVSASTAASSAALAQILVQDYEPRLLIYGTQARDYTISPEEEEAAVLLDAPWIRYKLGYPSPEGWLYDRSFLYRYRDIIMQSVRFESDLQYLLRATGARQEEVRDDYFPKDGQGPFDIPNPPSRDSGHGHDKYYFDTLAGYEVLPENLEALELIINSQSSTTQVVVVEMPVPETFFFYFGDGEQDYETFINTIRKSVLARSVPFWETTSLNLFTEDNWFNYSHLNSGGAVLFSEWFGRQLGEAVQNSSITLPSRKEG
jgi:hypothetical protein